MPEKYKKMESDITNNNVSYEEIQKAKEILHKAGIKN